METTIMPNEENNSSLFSAETVHNIIEQQINKEIGLISTNESILVEVLINNSKTLIATDFGFINPNFIIVWGFDESKNVIKVLLPHTKIQIMITFLKDVARRKPINFRQT
jgi:hypothetical protein